MLVQGEQREGEHRERETKLPVRKHKLRRVCDLVAGQVELLQLRREAQLRHVRDLVVHQIEHRKPFGQSQLLEG